MMKLTSFFIFFVLTGCVQQAVRPTLTSDEQTLIIQRCNELFSDSSYRPECIVNLTEALTMLKSQQQKRQAYITIGGSSSSQGLGADPVYPYPSENVITPNGHRKSDGGIPVYNADECIGVVVAGECHGSVLPKTAVPQKCYGEMLMGKCIGPQF